MSHYTLYGKANCPWCDKAKALLESRGDTYDYKDIKEDAILNELLTRFPEAKSVPQIFDGEDRIGGFDQLSEYFQKQGH